MASKYASIMENGFVKIDTEKNHPVVMVDFKSTHASDDEFNEYLSWLDQLLHQDVSEKFAIVFNPNNSNLLHPKQRVKLALWFTKNSSLIKTKMKCYSVVVTTIVQKQVLRSILYMVSSPVEYRVFTDTTQALNWCKQQIGS